ncbi:pyridoxal phosphate-dependent aminotransferase family protein [Nitratiruptor sp. YY09-18]|uniref:aminotransferase class I/II-fold pyridoxal phosphate-dependent enzyme n=1 Tax=Nitratiruptor sp. YY09-18 TaxID=2724901 RepID=UPI001916C742|nr:pyridoxal phosphate-dependent aminotransferase family protein [Nitratiruptor sp. YY09-18]BCD68627.1 8-amino-7-oxononanoate synthase [Nitratiruptor sp. YY09-18]
MRYDKELRALKRANRLRKRQLFDLEIKDFASNDYLGLAHKKELLDLAYQRIYNFPLNAAKASQLINGYTQIHYDFEHYMSKLSGFEDCITVGSGFLANIALIESLVRKGDTLVMDEEFHASGILASRLVENVKIFRHNDPDDLMCTIKEAKGRVVVAVEGVYSMSGDVLHPEIVDVVGDECLFIVDEAHSVGVVGERLLGVLDGKEIKPNYIKMGTLGKALGSYGAYILASAHIIEYLENRAKSIIYTTALSLMDVALAHEGMQEMQKNLAYYKDAIKKRQEIARRFGYESQSLIIDIPKKDVLRVQEELIKRGFLVGAIRPPTVPHPIVRIIARVGESQEDLEVLLELIREL